MLLPFKNVLVKLATLTIHDGEAEEEKSGLRLLDERFLELPPTVQPALPARYLPSRILCRSLPESHGCLQINIRNTAKNTNCLDFCALIPTKVK